MIVVDTSIISYFILPGEFTPDAERVRALDAEWIAPPLWTSEFRNVLRKYLLAGILSLDDVIAFADMADELMTDRVFAIPSSHVLRLVAASECTAYDCEFVALAQMVQVPLVTTDKELLHAFPDRAIHPSQFTR